MTDRFTQMHNDYLDPDRHLWPTEESTNDDLIDQFGEDYNSLADLDRALYKFTDCGASLAVRIHFTQGDQPVNLTDIYADNIKRLGTWEEMNEKGVLVTGLGVSSIVEGVEQTTDLIWLDWNPAEEEPESLREQFWLNVQEVERQAQEIWDSTHGCPTCAKRLRIEYEYGATPIDPECHVCDGKGEVI